MKDFHLEDAAKKQLAIFKEFKEFAMRGNVVDLAVGVVIGGAFGNIVSSLVKDVVMPPISRLTGDVNFANLFINLAPHRTQPDGTPFKILKDATDHGVPVIAYGQFLTNVIDFVIIAFCIFLMVKAINKLARKAPPPPEPTAQEKLLTEIRDLLKARS